MVLEVQEICAYIIRLLFLCICCLFFFFNENLKVETFNGLNHGRIKVHNVCFFFRVIVEKNPTTVSGGLCSHGCIIRKPCACSDPGFLWELRAGSQSWYCTCFVLAFFLMCHFSVFRSICFFHHFGSGCWEFLKHIIKKTFFEI